MHPLFDFAHWRSRRPVPGRAAAVHDRRGMVLPAQSKTGLRRKARTGYLACTSDAGMAVMYEDGKARFGARFLCYGESVDAVVLADASAYSDEICESASPSCSALLLGPAVYRHLDAAKSAIYIGSSKNPVQRQWLHGNASHWWPEVAEVTYGPYPTLLVARVAEREAIRAERPIHNVVYNSATDRRRRKTA